MFTEHALGAVQSGLKTSIKEAVETQNDIQNFLSKAMDVIDDLDDTGELLADLFQASKQSFADALRKDKTTYLYDELSAKGEHIKYGVTRDLEKRYSARTSFWKT